MLQRAASNAYSWWWASHVRTKQSKWLEHNLQDMEEKVKYMVEIIDEDGDSFAKRAEMYYKKRPELLSFVEEAYRGYRALAERYDHISRELQGANRTIATVYPEQAQFALDDEGEDTSKMHNSNDGKKPMNDLPDVPKIGFLKRSNTKSFGRRGHLKRLASNVKTTHSPVRCGMRKLEAIGEIDRLQKGILALQTEKEFVKSSYESGVAKYWDIEKEITEMQGDVSKLQDEFGIEMVIGDDEARTLMVSAAIRSCRYSLDRLKARNEQSAEEANEEYLKIIEAQEKFKELRNEPVKEDEENEDLQWPNSKGKLKEGCELDSISSHSMTELVEGIDGLVKKIISLETLVTSQTALVHRLRKETAELHARVTGVEKSSDSRINDSDKKMKEMKEDLTRVKKLSKNVEEQNHNLHIQFVEASCNLDRLSEKLQTLMQDDGVENEEKNMIDVNTKSLDKVEDAVDPTSLSETSIKEEEEEDYPGSPGTSAKLKDGEGEEEEEEEEEEAKGSTTDESNSNIECNLEVTSKICQVGDDGEEKKLEDDQASWRQLMCHETEERVEILLEEYTTILHDYREAKNKLTELEKKKRESLFESAMQIRDLRNANARKEDEIQALRRKLRIPKRNSDQSLNINSTDFKSATRSKSSPPSPHSLFDLLKLPTSSSRHARTTMADKFRADIDSLMEETLDFWLRFSTSYHQIQKFQTSIHDLKGEVSKVNKITTKSNYQTLIKTEVRPLYKHLREIQTELTLWRENNTLLKDELKTRSSSLNSIQEEIEKISSTKRGLDPETAVDAYQAAKFQGEVLNMKHENSKVEDELRESFHRVQGFQIEIERILRTMESDFGFQVVKSNHRNHQFSGIQRSSVPLRSFLFGVKSKKNQRKNSLFTTCINPELQKQYSDLGYGLEK